MTRMREPDVAELFHLHSSNARAQLPDLTVDADRPPSRFRLPGDGSRVELPGGDFAPHGHLGSLLAERRSVRAFAEVSVPLETAGRLLGAAAGLRGWREVDGEEIAARPYPSAGGRYPLEVHVATRHVEGLGDGVYHYDVRAHALELRREGCVQPALADMTIGQDMIAAGNLIVCVTAVFRRTMWKYGQRGYRYVWLDAGHLGQNLYLVAQALGLGAVAIGGFYDSELGELLGLGADERPVYLVCVGVPAAGDGAPPPPPGY
jgi:SagB-type dehydrogenase family enzyme